VASNGLSNKKVRPELFYDCNKTDAFADDTNVVLKQKAAVARRLVTILNEFEVISGLGCNIDKSAIMILGPRVQAEIDGIAALGFEIVDSLKILGTVISADGGDLSDNYENIYNKISNIIGIWRRFNLSLPGRIAISKTFLIAQVNYLGAVATPTAVQADRIQRLINEFVLGGTPVAKDRLYVSTKNGGLGLLNVNNMILILIF